MPKTLIGRGHPLALADEQRTVLRPGGRFRPFHVAMEQAGQTTLTASKVSTLQMNLGKLCNQTCEHCHVDAGPDRREVMTREVMEHCLAAVVSGQIDTVDLTGGAPEMNPDFRWLVERLRGLGRRVIDRCNLTILLANGYRDLPEFLARNRVEVVASLPCYTAENADAQRGRGVFDASVEAIGRLNDLGYGQQDTGLILDLVYNPVGPSLPGDQATLEADYRRELAARHGLAFNHLFTITNMPISRFLESLLRGGDYDRYMETLLAAHNPAAVAGVMCRTTLSVGYDGRLFDCDFNQMLELPIAGDAGPTIADFQAGEMAGRAIVTGLHCYGCTAGAGSSCGGALLL